MYVFMYVSLCMFECMAMQGIILARNEIPRSGEAVHYCYDLLAALTRDTHRVLAIIEEYDLFSMVLYCMCMYVCMYVCMFY